MHTEVRYQIFVDADGTCFILDTKESNGELRSQRGKVEAFQNLLEAVQVCKALNGHDTIILQGDANELLTHLIAG